MEKKVFHQCEVVTRQNLHHVMHKHSLLIRDSAPEVEVLEGPTPPAPLEMEQPRFLKQSPSHFVLRNPTAS